MPAGSATVARHRGFDGLQRLLNLLRRHAGPLQACRSVRDQRVDVDDVARCDAQYRLRVSPVIAVGDRRGGGEQTVCPRSRCLASQTPDDHDEDACGGYRNSKHAKDPKKKASTRRTTQNSQKSQRNNSSAGSAVSALIVIVRDTIINSLVDQGNAKTYSAL